MPRPSHKSYRTRSFISILKLKYKSLKTYTFKIRLLIFNTIVNATSNTLI